MISKEDKLQYGQLLRQQIKEREEAKKAQKRQFTPQQQNMPIQNSTSYQPPPMPKTPNLKPEQLKNPRELQKELLAKKMQENSYNPFGRGGGGAPVLQQQGIGNRQKSFSNQKNTQNMQIRRNSSFEKGKNSEQPPYFDQQMGRYGILPQGDPYRIPPDMMNPMQANPGNMNMQYKRISTPEFLQGAYNNAQFISPEYAPPAPYGYIAQDNELPPPQTRQLHEPYNQPGMPPMHQARQDPVHHQEILQNYNNRLHEMKKQEYVPTKQNTNNLNEQDMYKKGGRNLLKFENTEPSAYEKEQMKKQKLQQQLKMQIEEANRRKKQQERIRKEEQDRLQKKNLQFLAEEKRKYQEQLKGKQGQAKGVAQANSQKASEPVNLKKQKFQKIRQAVAQRQQEEKRKAMMKQLPTPRKQQKDMRHTPRMPVQPKPSHNDLDEVGSVISSDTQMSKGFNTAISKEFFKKERERNKIQKFSEEMQKMRKEIANQGDQFHEEINRLQREADRAKRQKQQADQQIVRLQKQLRKRIDDGNKKHLEQLYSGKVKINDPYYADEVKLEQRDNRSLKPRNSQQLILEEYHPSSHNRDYDEPNQLGNSDMMTMMSLVGDSKKIPLELSENQTTLSISKLGDFAKDTDYFKSRKNPASPSPQKYHPQHSIQEQDERAEQSRQSRRAKKSKPNDELDNLLKSRSKSRGGWGQMSSVNDDLVVEIDKMLNKNRQRPKSHLSSVGQRTLYSNENEKRSRIKNQQLNMKRKLDTYGEGGANDGTMNSLDELIQKYNM